MNFDELYVLHDCYVDSVSISDSGLCFTFLNGIYDSNNSKTKKCFLFFNIKDFNDGLKHISVFRYKKNRKCEITLDNFIKTVNRIGFRIYMDYYSRFSRSVLINGFIEDMEYDVTITELDDMCVVENDTI